MRKLPHVTVLFWVLKIVAVTLGETSGDLVGITLEIGYVVTALIFVGLFLVVVVAQVRAKRFHPALFWAVVLGTSMVGTEISDFLNRGFGHDSAQEGIGYAWGAVILTRPLGAAGGDSLIKPVSEGGLGWGTLWGSAALLGLLIVLIAYQTHRIHRRPLAPLPAPVNRRTG